MFCKKAFFKVGPQHASFDFQNVPKFISVSHLFLTCMYCQSIATSNVCCFLKILF